MITFQRPFTKEFLSLDAGITLIKKIKGYSEKGSLSLKLPLKKDENEAKWPFL